MGRKLYFPVTGVPTGTKFRIDQGGTNADNAPEALANLDGVAANKLNQANGLIKLNSSNKIDNDRIPPGYSGGYLGPMVEGLTSLVINQQGTYVITDYDQFMTYTLAAIGGAVSRVGNTITYTAPGVAGVSGFTLNGKTYNITIGAGNTVNQPTITSPANGAIGQPNNINFTASAFVVSSGSDIHEGSDWQISTNSNFTNIVQQVTNSAANKTTWTATFLNNNTTYYTRVRYKGTNYGYSPWSPTVTLITSAVPSYNVSVAGGTISEGQLVTFNITTSNVADTTLYWSIDTAPTNPTNSNDFISAINGSVAITNNAGVVTVTTLADMLLEGTENFIFALRSGSISGPTLATYNNSLLDTSYTLAGTQSLIVGNKYDNASKVAIAHDNGILILGICYIYAINKYEFNENIYTPCLIKLSNTDIRDNTFGSNGNGIVHIPEVSNNVPINENSVIGLHVNSSGKIYITGNTNGKAYVVILNSNGTRYNTFGTNGYFEFDFKANQYPSFAGSTEVLDSSINGDGDIYFATYINTDTSVGHGALVKLAIPDGTITTVHAQYASSYQAITHSVMILGVDLPITISRGMFNIAGSDYNNMIRNHSDNITISSTKLDTIYPSNYSTDFKIKAAKFLSNNGFLIVNEVETYRENSYSYDGCTNFNLLAFNTNLHIKTSFGTNGLVTINTNNDLGMGGRIYIRDLVLTDTHIYVIGSYRQGLNVTDYQAYCIIRLNIDGSIDTTFGTNGYTIVSINNRSDYARAAVYSTSRNKLVVVGDTDIIINSPSYTNPHNKSGSVGTLQTEVGVIFLNNTGNLA